MLVFKENAEKPADIIQVGRCGGGGGEARGQGAAPVFSSGFVWLSKQAKGMKKQIIDEFMSNNKFLLVPRLVNQKLFDELCPVKQFHRRRK